MGGNTRNHIKKALRWLHNIGTWQYLLVLIVMLFVSATCLRIDHIRMNNLKSEVLAADQTGDEEALIAKLNELRDYTNSHIVINIEDINGNFEVYFFLNNSFTRLKFSKQEKARRGLEKKRKMIVSYYSS